MEIVSENRFSGKTYFYTIGSRARLETRQAFPDRPKIITKHHFMRERKSSLVPIPKPFVVSTELNVRLPADHNNGRRNARTWKQHDGSTVIEGKD